VEFPVTVWLSSSVVVQSIHQKHMLGFIFFVSIFLMCDYLSSFYALPIPGSIIGLGLVLSVFAICGEVHANLISTANFMLRYLALMLVPICVGVTQLMDVVPAGLFNLIVVLFISMLVGCVAVAMVAQFFLSGKT
jgi:holin-like protein